MTITALAPWFGADRMTCHHYAQKLNGCSWVGIPFAGGMSILRHLKARTVVVNDLHRHVINLATVVADSAKHEELCRRLEELPFHPDVLRDAQVRCRLIDVGAAFIGSVGWAVDYFVSAWMARNGNAGTDGEFKAPLSIRWEAGGGDSATRFRNASIAIAEWSLAMRHCTFTCMDAFEFLDKCKDQIGHGIYVDAPWPDDGDSYTHKFTEADQRRLAKRLAVFKHTRVVVRFGDHPLIRELYTCFPWLWTELTGRTQANKSKAEVLITNDLF